MCGKEKRVSIAIFFLACLFVVPTVCVSGSVTASNFLLLRDTSFALHSKVFFDGQPIGRAYTQEGANTSPTLFWKNIPDGTVTLNLIMQDLDDVLPGPPVHERVHWLVQDIPASVNSLAAGAGADDSSLPSGASHGANDFGNLRYDGPVAVNLPPHTYRFKIFALDGALNTLAEATITATY